MAWPHDCVGLVTPIPPKCNVGACAGHVCSSWLFPTCVDQHCLCGGRGGQPTPGGTFFSQTPELVLMKGNNTKWQQAFEFTARGAGSRVFCLRIPELGCTSSVRSNVTLLRMSANRSPAKPIAGAALNTCAYEPSLHASMRGTRRVPAQ